MTGLIALAVATDRTLRAIHAEWANLRPTTGTFEQFRHFWMGECDSPSGLGFIHPEFMTRPGAFGNFWGM